MKQVLGISKVDEGRRIYFPRDLLNALGVDMRNKVSFELGNRVAIKNGDSGGISANVGSRQRVFVPKEVMERLKLSIGSSVIFLREPNRSVTISRLEERIR